MWLVKVKLEPTTSDEDDDGNDDDDDYTLESDSDMEKENDGTSLELLLREIGISYAHKFSWLLKFRGCFQASKFIVPKIHKKLTTPTTVNLF